MRNSSLHRRLRPSPSASSSFFSADAGRARREAGRPPGPSERTERSSQKKKKKKKGGVRGATKRRATGVSEETKEGSGGEASETIADCRLGERRAAA